MTIGQVTISAADWIASRVSDRMALIVAGQKSDLVEQPGSKAIQPTEENSGAQIERRARERSILVAQESYKRVAQRIKSRLANPLPPADETQKPASAASERTALIESLRSSPKLAASVIGAEGKTESTAQTGAQSRPDVVFGLVEPDSKKAEDRQAASVDEKEKEAAVSETQIRIEREQALDARSKTPVFEKGLWDDLFVAEHLSQEA